ncbi:MAG: hypothetical protein DHS20C19_25000 [Acidimicrobiales bacterium]|nr:MAG: hypothetical protein DHS20C19_25000 [Acidimicrobiales bacterium]
MSHDDELRSRIGRLAESRDIAPLTADEVIARRAAGVNRQRFLAVAAVVLLILGVAGVVAFLSSDDPDVSVASPEGDDGSIVQGVESLGDDPATPGNGDTQPVTTTVAPPATGNETDAIGSASDVGVDWGGGDWVVAWGDGFLSFAQVFEPSDLTLEELFPDIRDLFPAEIVEVVEASGAVTLEEQIDAVTEAGLLEEATAIFTEHPDLLDAFNQVQSGGTYRTVAQVSPDGETWTDLPDFGFPSGNDFAQQVVSDGTHLVVVDQTWTDDGGTAISVAQTTDLETWTVTEIPLAADTGPPHVTVDVWAGGLAIGADGWYLTVNENTYVDLWSLVPEWVFDEIGDRGYGFEATAAGIEVVIYDDIWAVDFEGGGVGVDEVPTTTLAPPERGLEVEAPEPPPFEEPEVLLTVSWDELPLTFEEYQEQQFESGGAVAWLGSFDGALSQATVPDEAADGCCSVIGTDAGFLAQSWHEDGPTVFFSPDGMSWSPVTLPAGIGWINALAAVEGGVVLIDESSGVWRGDADGSGWQAVTVDGLPENASIWLRPSSGRGVATILDAATYDWEPQEATYEAVIEHDGFEIVIENNTDGSGFVTITEIATGVVVLDEFVEETGNDDAPSFVLTDEDAGTFTFLDADDEVIVVVPIEAIVNTVSDAEDAAREFEGDAIAEPDLYVPDAWLIASRDGLTWHVEDLSDDPADGFFGQAAINGDTVVLRTWNGDWHTFDIR